MLQILLITIDVVVKHLVTRANESGTHREIHATNEILSKNGDQLECCKHKVDILDSTHRGNLRDTRAPWMGVALYVCQRVACQCLLMPAHAGEKHLSEHASWLDRQKSWWFAYLSFNSVL